MDFVEGSPPVPCGDQAGLQEGPAPGASYSALYLGPVTVLEKGWVFSKHLMNC